MSAITATYLDMFPDEILIMICDYVLSEPNTPHAGVNSSMYCLHHAWPNSRLKDITTPYMHHCIYFDGSASNLAQIMNGFLLQPETRVWARVLVLRNMGKRLDPQNPFKSIEDEFEWMAEASRRLGLKIEDIELPVTSQDGIAAEFRPRLEPRRPWPYKRLEFLAQVLHKVTKFCYYTNGDWIWPFPTLYKEHLQTLESQSEVNTIMTEPASRTVITPVPSALRSVNHLIMGHGGVIVHCQNPYLALLPAFFLPNIRAIQCSNIVCLQPFEDLTPLGAGEPHPHTSPITGLHITSCDIDLDTLEKFLMLPKALVEYCYKSSTYIGMNSHTLSAMGQLLSKYQSKSLEILTLDGAHSSYAQATPRGPPDERYIAPERIGPLRHFVKLRVISAPLWCLVSCSGEEIWNLPDVLPQSLEIIKLSIDWCPQLCVGAVQRHLRFMIEKKREMYPRLAKVEVHLRHIPITKEGPEWDFLYGSFVYYLVDLAMEQNLCLVIH